MSSPCLADSDCFALSTDIDGALVVEAIVSADVDNGFECRPDGIWVPITTPAASTLAPVGDYDGQRRAWKPVIATADNDIEWDMRWDDADATWYFVGGAPAFDHVFTFETISAGSGTWETLATDGPILNLPYTGTYSVRWGAVINGAEAGTNTEVGLQLGGTDPASDAHVIFEGGQAQRHTAAAETTVSLTSPNTGIRLRYQRNGTATSASFGNRFLSVIPIHVEP